MIIVVTCELVFEAYLDRGRQSALSSTWKQTIYNKCNYFAVVNPSSNKKLQFGKPLKVMLYNIQYTFWALQFTQNLIVKL